MGETMSNKEKFIVSRDQLEKWQKTALEWGIDSIGVDIMHTLAQPDEQHKGEPVARLNTATGNVITNSVVVMDWDDEKEHVQSLYTHPAPAVQQAAVGKLKDGDLIMMANKAAPHASRDNDMFYIAMGRLVEDHYTHADAGGVERLSDRLKIMTRFRDEFEIKAELLEEENEKLRSELSDAIQSLKTISNLAGRDEFMLDIDDVRQYANSRSIAASYMLSASAEPSAQVEIDERADFEVAHVELFGCLPRTDDQESDFALSHYNRWLIWQARAALERKP